MTLRLSFIRKILKIHLSLSTSMENRKERAWNLMESMERNNDWSPLMRAASKFCPFIQGRTVQIQCFPKLRKTDEIRQYFSIVAKGERS